MIGLRLPDLKTATAHIFTRPSLDYFLLKEAVVVTSNVFTIDGAVKKDYFSQEELEGLRDPEWMEWKLLRPACFSLIKGKKLPLSFQIALALSRDNVDRLIRQNQVSFRPEEIGGLYLNFRYEKKTLTAISATSLKTFSMDKSLEQLWDDTVKTLLRQLEIPFEE